MIDKVETFTVPGVFCPKCHERLPDKHLVCAKCALEVIPLERKQRPKREEPEGFSFEWGQLIR